LIHLRHRLPFVTFFLHTPVSTARFRFCLHGALAISAAVLSRCSVRGSRDADPSQASRRSPQGPGAHRRARSDLGGAAEDVAHRSVAERDPTAASSLAASAAARYTLRSAMDSRLERWATVAAAVGLLLSSCRRAPAP